MVSRNARKRDFLIPLLSIASVCLSVCPSVAAENQTEDHLPVVRATIDALLTHGVDRWGPEETAMIISILDRKTLEPFKKLPKAAAGARESDRSNVYGSNANMQQNLYRTMFLLSDITGEHRYAEAAEAALIDFVRRTQSPATGLLGWGEHLFYDLKEDRVSTNATKNTTQTLIHEIKKAPHFFGYLLEREPDRTIRYARGLWDHAIGDQKSGDFSRHAKWDKHDPRTGFDFTKEAGYMIDIWSRTFAVTRDGYFRRPVEVLATRYRNKLNSRYLLDYDSSRPNYCNNGHNVTLALECHEAAARFSSAALPDDPTAKLLRDLAESIDRGFLAVNHAPGDQRRGFIATSFTDTGEPRDREGAGPGGYSVMWGFGYGKQTTAMIALHCYHRMKQLPAGDVRDAYGRLFLEAARAVAGTSLPKASEKQTDVWAVEPGAAILLEVAAFRETGEASYLEAAQRLAAEAKREFWPDESPLPKASLLRDQYEAMTGADALLLALLAVHGETHQIPVEIPISDIDR